MNSERDKMRRIVLGSILKEIVEKTTVNNQHPVLTSSQNGLVSQDEYFNKQIASQDNTGYKIIRKGQFTYRAMSDTGRFYINQSSYDIGIVSPAYPVFEITNTNIVLPEYIAMYFKSESFQNAIALQSTGSTRVSLKLNKIKDLEIFLPDVAQQREMLRNIAEAESLIQARREQLAKLDELVKYRFVELFGDPVLNPFSWEMKRFDEICENLDSRRKPISSGDRVEGIYPYYGASGIVDYVEDYIFDEDILLVSEDGANLLMRSTPIAFSVSGKVWVNNHAHVVRFDKMSLQKYVEIYFSLIDISDSITGSAQPKLNQAKLNAMMIPIPEDMLLDRYYEFLYQVDKSKLAIQESLAELETLKKALMQKYFG